MNSPKKYSAPLWTSLFNFTTRRHLWFLVPALVSSMASGATIPVNAYLLGRVFGTFTSFNMNDLSFKHEIAKYTSYIVINGTTSWLFNFTAYTFWHIFGDLQARSARERLFNVLLLKPSAWFDRRTEGISTLTTRVLFSVRELQTANSQPISLSAQYMSTFIGSFILAFYLSWKLTLVVIAGVPLIALIMPVISSKLQKHNEAQGHNLTNASKLASSAISHIETVKCYNGEESTLQDYRSEICSAEKCYISQAFWDALQTGIIRVSTLAMFVQGFWFGGMLLQRGQITSGEIVAAFWASILAIQGLINIMPHILRLEKGRAAGHKLRIIMKLHELDVQVNESAEPLMPAQFAGDVAFENVSFSYPTRPTQLALKNVNLFFAAGDTTFLIGKSGSGKSTVGQLLVRFYSPTKGKITLDGLSISLPQLDGIREKVLLVEQQSTLFTGSVRENIALGNVAQDVAMSDIHSAATFASMKDTIDLMSGGFHTKVGTKGDSLSGGQRQRVAIARAWLRDPPILILDESTSALDHVNRAAVMSAIRKWRTGKTTIIITHDTSQILPDDFVYVMSNGQVVQEGFRRSIETVPSSEFLKFLTEVEPETESNSDIATWAQNSDTTANEEDLRYDEVLDLYLDEPTVQSNRFSVMMPLVYSGTTGAILADHADSTQSPTLTAPFWRLRAPNNGQNRTSGYENRQSWFQRPNSPLEESEEFRSSSVGAVIHKGPHKYPDASANQEYGAHPSPIASTFEMTDIKEAHSEREEINETLDQDLARSNEEVQMHNTTTGMLTIFRTIWSHFKASERYHLFLATFACILYAVSTPIFSYVFALLLSTVYVPEGRQTKARTYSLVVLGVAVVDGLSMYLTTIKLAKCGQVWVNRLRDACFQRVLAQPREFFDREENSLTRLLETLDTHGEVMQHIISRCLGNLLIIFVMASTAIIWSFITCWKLTAVLLACSPLLFAISYAMQNAGGKLDEQVTSAAENAGVIFSETFTSISTVRALTLEQYFRQKHHTATEIALKLGIKRAVICGSLFGLSESAVVFLTALVFYYGSVLLSSGQYSMQDIFQMSLSRDAANRVLRLAALPKACHEQDGTTRISHAGNIEFNKVNFAYPGRAETRVLRDVDLSIPEGQCVSIVGLSGSGKSTIASLLLKLYTATETTNIPPDPNASSPIPGDISISNIPIHQIDTRNLRFLVSIVSQKPTIFPTTVGLNITYGLRPASSLNTQTNIESAARAAGAHEFIASLPNGYETLIGEGGTGLSGGQAQRIAVARALIRRPNILILDEVTSALDEESAGLIRKTIQALLEADRSDGGRRMTIIIITHSREMMKVADSICMMEQGSVVETGIFEELMKKGGAFARLFRGKGVDV